jgi:hypothetical protein
VPLGGQGEVAELAIFIRRPLDKPPASATYELSQPMDTACRGQSGGRSPGGSTGGGGGGAGSSGGTMLGGPKVGSEVEVHISLSDASGEPTSAANPAVEFRGYLGEQPIALRVQQRQGQQERQMQQHASRGDGGGAGGGAGAPRATAAGAAGAQASNCATLVGRIIPLVAGSCDLRLYMLPSDKSVTEDTQSVAAAVSGAAAAAGAGAAGGGGTGGGGAAAAAASTAIGGGCTHQAVVTHQMANWTHDLSRSTIDRLPASKLLMGVPIRVSRPTPAACCAARSSASGRGLREAFAG